MDSSFPIESLWECNPQKKWWPTLWNMIKFKNLPRDGEVFASAVNSKDAIYGSRPAVETKDSNRNGGKRPTDSKRCQAWMLNFLAEWGTGICKSLTVYNCKSCCLYFCNTYLFKCLGLDFHQEWDRLSPAHFGWELMNLKWLVARKFDD